MSDSMRKRDIFTSRTTCLVCLLCLVLAPLVSSIQDASSRIRSNKSFSLLARAPRCGGGDNGDRNNDEDSDDEERTRFWSLSALFRLNANAKDDAASPPPSSYLQRGNKRGGALAVRTSKSKTFVDVTPVSTAASRLMKEDDESDRIEEDEEPDEVLQHVFQQYGVEQDTDVVEIDEIEEMDAPLEEEQGYEDETLSIPASGASARLIKDDVKESDGDEEESAEILLEDQDFSAEEMEGVDIRQDMTRCPTETSSLNKEAISAEEETELQESQAKGMLQDASKFWWTNVWTEQVSEEVPDLGEVVSDVSDADISVSVAGEVIGESERDEEASDETEIDVGIIDVQAIDLDQVEEQKASTASDEPTSQFPIRRKEEVEVIEEVDVDDRSRVTESMETPSQDSFETEKSKMLVKETIVEGERPELQESPFISSGYWATIDRVASLGLSNVSDGLKLSRHLRSVRKATARVTGLHGFVSQKGKRLTSLPENTIAPSTGTDADSLNDEDLGRIRRRIAAIEIARKNVARRAAERAAVTEENRRGFFRRIRRMNRANDLDATATTVAPELDEFEISSMHLELEQKSLEEQLEEKRRKERVQEIDRIILKRQQDLLDLQCEKDALQRRPNPLYNYDTSEDGKTTREFNFPPQELVDEYIDELVANGRLEKMNHTDLWKNGADFDDEEDESIGDDLFVPSADARKLYERRREKPSPRAPESKSSNGNGGGGSWLLRQNLGKGGSLGEKIGEAVETAAYKAVCANVMSALARSIAAIHGVNIMTYSDIRLYMEQSPDLPPVGKSVIPGSTDAQNYAQEAIMDAMRKGVKRKRRGSRSRRMQVEEAFLQRDAVVETLLSHCQISAPLLKLFPLSWQRALLGNIITLIAAVVSDFCDGIQLQILGHQLSFAFKPITESDMIRHIGMGGNAFNIRRASPEQFEAAIAATADDVSERLQFLDRWHHRALGSGMLRAQIANLIARIVLTLADEVLSGAQMNLWSAQAGGPQMVAGLEYRVSQEGLDEVM